MRILKISALIALLTLIGCSGIRSSVCYTKGSQCLERREYQEAVYHLEKACRLDPSFSRNHCNLACAYLETNQIEKAWYEIRQAAFLDTTNQPAVFTFKNILEALERSHNLVIGTSSLKDVYMALGNPDREFQLDEFTYIRYGLSIWKFKKELLIDKKIVDGLARRCYIYSSSKDEEMNIPIGEDEAYAYLLS